jgi:hypothetical protein
MHARFTAAPGAMPVYAPENEKAAEGFFLGRLQIASAIHRVLCVWSLSFVGRGLRLALGTDDPFGEIRPIAPRAHVSYGASAPGRCRVYGRDRHGLLSTHQNASAIYEGLST